MSEVIYSDLRLQHLSEPQRRQELQKPKIKCLSSFRKKDFSASPSWKFIAVMLGIICLVLLLSVGLLAIKLNQNSFNAEGHQGNKTVWKYPTCSSNWHQLGEKCYFFSRNSLPWNECPHYCSGLNARFLKVDTEEEMSFVVKLSKIQCEMSKEMFFIDIYYNNEQQKWVWLDGTDLILDNFQILGHKNADNKCKSIKYGHITVEDCQSYGYCICKKTVY